MKNSSANPRDRAEVPKSGEAAPRTSAPDLATPKTGPMTAEEGRKEAFDYYERKKIALGREKNNCEFVIFVKGNGKRPWLKAFKHSAIFFEKLIAPKIGSTAVAKPDVDYKYNVGATPGVVSYPSLQGLKEKLGKLGCKLIDDRDGVYIFKLWRKVEAAELEVMLQEGEDAAKRANKNLVPKFVRPELFEALRKLHLNIHGMIARMTPLHREEIGFELERNARIAMRKYYRVARKGADVRGILEGVFDILNDMSADAAGMLDTKIDRNQKIFDLSALIVEAKKEVTKELKICAVEEIEEKHQ